MPEQASRRYGTNIQYIVDGVGYDVPRDVVSISLDDQELTSVIVDTPAGDQLDANLDQVGGTDQTGVDVADKLQQLADALQSAFDSDDQLRVDLENHNAGTLPVEQQTPIVLEGDDNAGNTESVQVEALDTALNGTESAVITAVARALSDVGNAQVRVETPSPIDASAAEVDVDLNSQSVGNLAVEQQTPVAVEDTTGTQVNPDQSPDYPDSQTVGHDLIASGDLVIGPVSVARAEAIVVAVNSTNSETFSVSVSWENGSGDVFQSEDKTETGIDTVTSDWARLVRKGPQVKVTITDESGAGQNLINAHVDTER